MSALVFDRTAGDVSAIREIRSKAGEYGWDALTAEELAVWAGETGYLFAEDGLRLRASDGPLLHPAGGTVRGAYNRTDLNRVETAVGDLADRLRRLPETLRARAAQKGVGWDGLYAVSWDPEDYRVKRLPEGYTALEYIESTGTQYIDTGFTPGSRTKVVCDYQCLTTLTTVCFLFGVMDDDLNYYYGIRPNPAQYQYRMRYGTQNYITIPTTDDVFSRTTAVMDGPKLTVGTASASLADEGEWRADEPMWLFCRNVNGEPSTIHRARLYSCKIYDGGTLARDFIPCVNGTGEAGLYDAANGQFYGNAGTGTFLAGPEAPAGSLTVKTGWDHADIPTETDMARYLGNVKAVTGALWTPLEYLDTDGASYIDTGIYPNQDTRVVCDFQLLENIGNNSYSAIYGGGTSVSRTPRKAMLALSINTSSEQFQVRYGGYIGYFPLESDEVYGRHLVDQNGSDTQFDGGGSVGFGDAWGFSFRSECPLYLGAIYDQYGVYTSFASAVRFYSCKIYQNGTLVRDFVPYRNAAGAVGMRDLVEDVFYPNIGPGRFTAGPEAAEVREPYGLPDSMRKLDHTGANAIEAALAAADGILAGEEARLAGLIDRTAATVDLSWAMGLAHAELFGGISI